MTGNLSYIITLFILYYFRPNLLDIFTSVCTGLAELNDARYDRRQFSPGPSVRTRPLLRHGDTLVDSIKFWEGEEISNRCFCHVIWHVGHCIPFQQIKHQSILFSGPYGGSPRTLFTFTYLLRVVA